jgi:hypothetical protein
VSSIINPNDPVLLDEEVAFDQDRITNDLIIKTYQHIPDSFISDLKAGKMDSFNKRSGEMQLMMSVPVSVINDIKARLGYDMMEEPMRRSIQLLKALHLDAFITSDKQI